MQVDENMMHYLSGVLDAKLWLGIVNMDKTYPSVRAQVPCDDYNTARLIGAIVGGGSVVQETSGGRMAYKIIFTRRADCNNLLMLFAPYTRTKRELYDAFIEFMEYHDEITRERKLLSAAAGGTAELVATHEEHRRIMHERAVALRAYVREEFVLKDYQPQATQAPIGHRAYDWTRPRMEV